MTFKCYDCDTAIIDSDAVFKTIAGFSAPLCKTCHVVRYPDKEEVKKALVRYSVREFLDYAVTGMESFWPTPKWLPRKTK